MEFRSAGGMHVRGAPPQERAMKVLACDGIHEDGLALFRDAGWTVGTVPAAQLLALRSIPGVLSLETL